MTVLVLGGGDSPEREVSLRSSKAVADAARAAGFDVLEADPAEGIGVLGGLPKETVVLPILHGKNGEDGDIQSKLEKIELPFLGSDSSSSAKCFDKWQTRQELERVSIPIPRGGLVNRDDYLLHPLSHLPHVLKTPKGGSSIGTLIVRKPGSQTEQQIEEIFEFDPTAVIEELIEGTEVTVPVLDQSALTPIEIIPPPSAEFDYENKYNGRTQELCPPQSVSLELQQKCKDLAEKTHRTMGCRHLSRVDMMLDKSGNVFVLEINTIPGLTDQSLYPKSAAVSGFNMPELVSEFVKLVLRDYKIAA